ncbi:MAG: twin-arginine translocase TatA/TatE family subunit [Planctomycetes bacterium]|nr:twin-arginine translocase TatA/TatE family subunit [Planctomycetota bacterium]
MIHAVPVVALFGIGEWWIILALALLFFGASRLPGIARSLGRSVNEFKAGMKDDGSAAAPGADATGDGKSSRN